MALKNIETDTIQAIIEDAALCLYPGDPPSGVAFYKARPEDFLVEEIPLYPASGQGEHLMILVEKRMLSTIELIDRLADLTGADRRDIGVAGRKDSMAITRQFISLPKRCEVKLRDGDGFRIVSASPHSHKLRLGHSRGNRFRIILRELDGIDPQELIRRLSERATQGFWNIFGAQRFSERGRGLAHALEWIESGCPRLSGPVSRPQFLASVWQSAILNWAAILRVRSHLSMEVTEGDVAIFAERRSENATDERRVPSGPMWGPEMKRATGVVESYESLAYSAFAPPAPSQSRLFRWATGERRPLVVQASAFEGRILAGNQGIEAEFSLPSGSFATVFLSSVVRLKEAAVVKLE